MDSTGTEMNTALWWPMIQNAIGHPSEIQRNFVLWTLEKSLYFHRHTDTDPDTLTLSNIYYFFIVAALDFSEDEVSSCDNVLS